MKKIILCLIAICGLAATMPLLAQQTSKTITYKIDETSVVKDSTGNVIPYEKWAQMMRTRLYKLRPEKADDRKTAFIITKRDFMDTSSHTTIISRPFIKRKADETSLVKDSSGMIYPYTVWTTLMYSGKYVLRQPISDSDYFLISKLSKAQLDQMMASYPKPKESTQFVVGSKMRPFSERDMHGQRFDLKKLTGKVIVLNFWFIGCPPCRQEIPELNEMMAAYNNNPDVVFIAVALDQADDISDFLKSHPFNYHIIDNGGYISQMYGVHLYPTNVVINRDGKIIFSSEGFSAAVPYTVNKNIEAALAAPVNTTAAQ